MGLSGRVIRANHTERPMQIKFSRMAAIRNSHQRRRSLSFCGYSAGIAMLVCQGEGDTESAALSQFACDPNMAVVHFYD